MKILLYITMLSLVFSSTALGQNTPKKSKAKEPKKQISKSSDYQLYSKAGEKSPKWDEFIAPAFESFDSGNMATAYVFLKKAFEAGSRDGLVLYRLGIYMESIGRYAEAGNLLLEAATKIAKQYPGTSVSQKINEHAGRALFLADNYDLALPQLKKALEFSPENFILLFMTGQILRMKKMPTEARPYFEKALTVKVPEGISPDIKQKILEELVAITFSMKDYTACKIYFDELAAKFPMSPVIPSYQQNLDRMMNKMLIKKQI